MESVEDTKMAVDEEQQVDVVAQTNWESWTKEVTQNAG